MKINRDEGKEGEEETGWQRKRENAEFTSK